MSGEAARPGGPGAPDDLRDLGLGGDPELVHAADLLSRSLVRFHPSFRFEERLAERLHEGVEWREARDWGAAAPAPGGKAAPAPWREAAPAPPSHPRHIIPFPALPVAGGSVPFALAVAPAALGQAIGRVPRPVLVGGAIASGVSLAGAAVVAWRLAAWSHPAWRHPAWRHPGRTP
ncbi:MAG: hypothetical protein ACP5VP_00045 [Candidatus Limnocylindrales bacterium]